MIINQPYDKQLGAQLIEAIESSQYTQLTIIVAYAKLSGVHRISPYIKKLCENGGSVRCIVGIDQQNTTYDALLQLLNLTNNVYVFHSENFSQTFHVKCYWLAGDNKCWYAIGSNNLTAGGLFSNYELSTVAVCDGNNANIANTALEKLYIAYTKNATACSHKLEDDFLTELLSEGYVVKELQQRKQFAESIKRAGKKSQKKKLFGSEVFTVPALPEQYRTKTEKGKHDIQNNSESKNKVQVCTAYETPVDNAYLIRLIPGAGNRSKQVHFTVALLKKYFCLSQGDNILVQEMLSNGNVMEIEHRQIVFSERNRNVKIELNGASILDNNYPKNPDTRPVLIIKRLNTNLYVYMILMDGNQGYTQINNHLKALPKVGNALQYEVIDESLLYSLWGDCPIV